MTIVTYTGYHFKKKEVINGIEIFRVPTYKYRTALYSQHNACAYPLDYRKAFLFSVACDIKTRLEVCGDPYLPDLNRLPVHGVGSVLSFREIYHENPCSFQKIERDVETQKIVARFLWKEQQEIKEYNWEKNEEGKPIRSIFEHIKIEDRYPDFKYLAVILQVKSETMLLKEFEGTRKLWLRLPYHPDGLMMGGVKVVIK